MDAAHFSPKSLQLTGEKRGVERIMNTAKRKTGKGTKTD